MTHQSIAQAVAVYIGADDHWQGKPLATVIVEKARQVGLAGATVLHGTMGFGANSVIHSSHILSLSEDLPIVVHLVDAPDKIAPFLEALDEVLTGCLVVSWNVVVHRYTPGKSAEKPS